MDLDASILSSTTVISKSNGQNRRRQRSQSVLLVGEQSQNSIQESICSPPPTKKPKKTTGKVQAPRTRKLRPEDERTMKILSEKFQSHENGMKCQIKDCQTKPLQCAKPSNLKRHLNDKHREMYQQLFPNEVSKKKQIELEAYNLAQDAIELVTVNGYPFTMLNASGMLGFIKPRQTLIRSDGHGLSIDRKSIVKLVAKQSDRVREYIAQELKGKTFSIMFDVCTIATLSMLGVNVTFMKDVEVVCRSLGTIDIRRRHTAVNLADMIYDILADFELSLFNVLTMTTDTAKNAVATTEVLNSIASENVSRDMATESSSDIDEDDGELEFGIDIENEAELQRVMENIAAHNQLVTEMAQTISDKNTSIQLINQVNCGTHVFQLSVNDSLKESNSLGTIEMVHKMCVLMRTQIVMIEIRKLGCKVILPPLENDTRWNGKFLMVSFHNK